MMESTRYRPDRSAGTRSGRPKRKAVSSLESLETRQLLTGPMAMADYYSPSIFPPRTISHFSPNIAAPATFGSPTSDIELLDNVGRIVSGKDREFDEYVLTIHGPGYLIVTDATPNDGSLDDDIDTIQIVGSNPHTTYVTGQSTASARLITDGQIDFNHLIAESGVQSIILNGFNLTNTVLPPFGQAPNVGPEIYLPGGVKTLQFNNINAMIDPGLGAQAFDIVIGNPTTPLTRRPDIKIGRVSNTVIDSTLGIVPGGTVRSDPTVNFQINGQAGKVELVSAAAAPAPLAGFEVTRPVQAVSGRTAIRAQGIDQIKVYGSARNLTASRAGRPFQPQDNQPGVPSNVTGTQPFRSANSGLDHLGSASFGGVTDGVGLDVDGRIGSLTFARGLGDPIGVLGGNQSLGYNPARRGNASYGLLGGLVTAQSIGHITAGPANTILQTPQDPDFVQLLRKGSTHYLAQPGNALTASAITTDGSIDSVDLLGNAQSSEIKTGFNYQSYIAGLEGTRSASQIRSYRQRGDLVDSVISATYRPTDNVYGNANDVAGPGTIRGRLEGRPFFLGGRTALNNVGAGVYARNRTS